MFTYTKGNISDTGNQKYYNGTLQLTIKILPRNQTPNLPKRKKKRQLLWYKLYIIDKFYIEWMEVICFYVNCASYRKHDYIF